jgi:hypothetical protein
MRNVDAMALVGAGEKMREEKEEQHQMLYICIAIVRLWNG